RTLPWRSSCFSFARALLTSFACLKAVIRRSSERVEAADKRNLLRGLGQSGRRAWFCSRRSLNQLGARGERSPDLPTRRADLRPERRAVARASVSECPGEQDDSLALAAIGGFAAGRFEHEDLARDVGGDVGLGEEGPHG